MADPVARRSPLAWALLGLVLVVHLYSLYDPAPSGASLPISDKVVHALLFGVPVLVGGLMGLSSWWPALVAAHAPVSEIVQHALIPTRSGDPWDVIADLVGIALALGVVAVLRRRTDTVVVEGPPSRW